MKLLVTGICGRLGRALAAEASLQGHDVVGVDRVPWPEKSELPKGVKIAVASYEDMAQMAPLLKSRDVLIHAAGPNGEHVKTLSLAEFLRANVESVANLLELAVQAGIKRAVLSSTMEVLIGRDWTASGAAVLDEDSPPRTDSAYSVSRLLQEHLAREFCRRNPISIASLRYMAFGYGDDRKLGPQLLARCLSARDTARAVLRAAAVDGLQGDVFHIGPKTPLTNSDIIAAKSQPEAVLEKYFPGAAAVLARHGIQLKADHFWPVTSIRKARLVLEWEPADTFEGWLREQGWQPPTPAVSPSV